MFWNLIIVLAWKQRLPILRFFSVSSILCKTFQNKWLSNSVLNNFPEKQFCPTANSEQLFSNFLYPKIFYRNRLMTFLFLTLRYLLLFFSCPLNWDLPCFTLKLVVQHRREAVVGNSVISSGSPLPDASDTWRNPGSQRTLLLALYQPGSPLSSTKITLFETIFKKKVHGFEFFKKKKIKTQVFWNNLFWISILNISE